MHLNTLTHANTYTQHTCQHHIWQKQKPLFNSPKSCVHEHCQHFMKKQERDPNLWILHSSAACKVEFVSGQWFSLCSSLYTTLTYTSASQCSVWYCYCYPLFWFCSSSTEHMINEVSFFSSFFFFLVCPRETKLSSSDIKWNKKHVFVYVVKHFIAL